MISSSTTTLGAWLNQFEEAYGAIVAVSIGAAPHSGRNPSSWPPLPVSLRPLAEVPVEVLTHEFDPGYGAPGCPAVWAWSNTHTFVIIEYDGSTSWAAVPRYMSHDEPRMYGGPW